MDREPLNMIHNKLGRMIKVYMDSNDQMDPQQAWNGARFAAMAYISKWTTETSRPEPTSIVSLWLCVESLQHLCQSCLVRIHDHHGNCMVIVFTSVVPQQYLVRSLRSDAIITAWLRCCEPANSIFKKVDKHLHARCKNSTLVSIHLTSPTFISLPVHTAFAWFVLGGYFILYTTSSHS